MRKHLFLLATLPLLFFSSCSSDDGLDYDLIEGSWGLVHSEGFDKEDPSDPVEWEYNCNPLAPSTYDDAKIDIMRIEDNKFFMESYYYSTYSKKWVKHNEGYSITIKGNTVIPTINGEEFIEAGFQIVDLTSTNLVIEVKEGSTYYAKNIYKRLQ